MPLSQSGARWPRLSWVFWLAPLLLAGCSVLSGPYLAPEPTASLPPTVPAPTLAASPTALPTVAATEAPATVAPTAETPATASSEDVSLDASSILLHPGPGLYSGDFVSFEVLANTPPGVSLAGLPVAAYRDALGGELIGTARYGHAGIGQREEAILYWAWNTHGLVGPQTLVIAQDTSSPILANDPDLSNNAVTITVNLLPAEARPQPEPQAHWATAETDCCVFNYLTGTAAERDLPHLEEVAGQQVQVVESRLEVSQIEKLQFTLLSRLLGHGGFAADSISISYLDRDYAGGDIPQVFRHESVHILDRQLAHTRPVIMTEGLAVYISGGHFKIEDLEARAVALVAMGGYIPLQELADNFYISQHETGYLEAGAFVDYLVQTHGWQAFRAFYSAFHSAPSDSAMLDAALRLNFGLSLQDTEAAWLEHLRSLPVDPRQVADVRDSIAFYDTVRRYQQLYDPSAYYLTAWLPDVKQMQQRGMVADLLRHPDAPGNVTVETMLAEAAKSLAAGDYAQTEWLTASVNAVLGEEAATSTVPDTTAFTDPLAAQYLAVVQSSLAAGYEPQQVALAGNSAQVEAIQDWPQLASLTFSQSGADWVLSSH